MRVPWHPAAAEAAHHNLANRNRDAALQSAARRGKMKSKSKMLQPRALALLHAPTAASDAHTGRMVGARPVRGV